MPIRRGAGFREQFRQLPEEIREKAKRQMDHMAADPFYPSAHLKRIQGSKDWWEARVDDNYRFGLQLIDGVWTFLVVGDHKSVLGR
jgi:hypothetical protein